MGSNLCSHDNKNLELSTHPWQFKFGQDMLSPKIQHKDNIKCKVHQIQPNVRLCQQKLRQSGRLFKDPTIQTKQVMLAGKDKSQIHCVYNRPQVFVDDKQSKQRKCFQIFNQKHTKISQVVINNAGLQYFGPFLCFLAQFPELINSIIMTEANTYGLHVVAVNIQGKKQYLYIDDYILCQKEYRLPLFAQPIQNKYIWPCLIQKSWLKIHGNATKKIFNFLPQEIFETYLSIPTKTYILTTSHQHNMRLVQTHIHRKSKYARCIITIKAQPQHKIGISGRKQYYLLSHFQGEHEKWYYHFTSPCKINNFRGSNNLQQFKFKILDYNQDEMQQHTFILDEQQFIEQVQQFFIIYHQKQTQYHNKSQVYLRQNQQLFAKAYLNHDDHLSISYNQCSSSKEYHPIIYHVVDLKRNQCISDLDDPQACFGVKNAYLLENIYAHVHSGELLMRIKKRKNRNQRNSRLQDSDQILINSKKKIDIQATSEKQKQFQQEFYRFLKLKGEKKLQLEHGDRGIKSHDEVKYVSFWLGNLAVVYIKKIAKQKTQVKLQVNFPQLKNLQCLTHPTLKKDFASLTLTQDNLLIVFEKIDPSDQTIFGKYSIQSF